MLSIFKIGKTHVPHRKHTAEMPAVRMKPPALLYFPTVQHIGAPANPTVKPGDKVYVGTLIAEAGGKLSSPIYSSVSGSVKKIETQLLQSGKSCPMILIESDGEMTPEPNIKPPKVTNFKELSDAVAQSGLVGLGGAGFPTAVKLNPDIISSIDTLLINAAECEPYITADTRTMLDDSEWIKEGMEAVLKLSGIPRAIIGIEANKPECIKKMNEVFESNPKVSIERLPSSYPQGAEKILIYNTTGRVVPMGKLPSDVGVIVLNVTTLAFIAKYLKTGMPLVEKCITVDGEAVKEPKNVIVPIGTPFADVFEFAGGLSDDAAKIIMGGPMMGIANYSLDTPVLKNTNAALAFSENEAKIGKSTACIHCGRCASACPMGLNPTVYARAMKLDDKDERAARLEDAKLNLCMECGSCSFVCPAKRPLVENNRLSKQFMREYGAELKAKSK